LISPLESRYLQYLWNRPPLWGFRHLGPRLGVPQNPPQQGADQPTPRRMELRNGLFWTVLLLHWELHLGPPPEPEVRRRQGAPTETNKKSDVPTYLLFLRFFEIFRSDFRKDFCGVFGLLMQRNGQKRDKKNRWEDERKKFLFLNFFGQKFLTWFSPKKVLMVFLNSPC
jgi:hypothetical protein